MKAIAKFLSLAEAEPGSTQVSVGVLFQAQLEDGKCIVLLDDRGFSTCAQWQQARPEEIRDTALAMVGPDEPAPGRTQAEALHDYWDCIASLLAAQQIQEPAEELVKLEHEVRFGPRLQRLLAWSGR